MFKKRVRRRATSCSAERAVVYRLFEEHFERYVREYEVEVCARVPRAA